MDCIVSHAVGSLWRVYPVHGTFGRVLRSMVQVDAYAVQNYRELACAGHLHIEHDVPTPEDEGKDSAAVALGRRGGKARAEGMSAKRRK